jgi:predicted N-acetyltransferase YhbS
MFALIALVPLAEVSTESVETILDRAFGADRRARTAYRVRAGTAAIPELSFAAIGDDGALLGTIQCWPVALACDDGGAVPMVMVGPVAVQPEQQRQGIGHLLMERMLAAVADAALPGRDSLMLIGDPEYYGRFYGFTAERTAGWRLPGPFEARRLLALGEGVPECTGEVGPRVLKAAA